MDFGRSIRASNGMHQVLFVTSLEHNAGPSRLPSGLSSFGRPGGSNEFKSARKLWRERENLPTWDGSDLNRFTEEQPANIMGSMFCSRRVLDLVAREKWTNIQFVPVGALEPMSIDFLKGPWPPLAWCRQYQPE